MTRRTIAIGIIGLWAVGIALLYRSSTFRSAEQSLAEAGKAVVSSHQEIATMEALEV